MAVVGGAEWTAEGDRGISGGGDDGCWTAETGGFSGAPLPSGAFKAAACGAWPLDRGTVGGASVCFATGCAGSVAFGGAEGAWGDGFAAGGEDAGIECEDRDGAGWAAGETAGAGAGVAAGERGGGWAARGGEGSGDSPLATGICCTAITASSKVRQIVKSAVKFEISNTSLTTALGDARTIRTPVLAARLAMDRSARKPALLRKLTPAKSNMSSLSPLPIHSMRSVSNLGVVAPSSLPFAARMAHSPRLCLDNCMRFS